MYILAVSIFKPLNRVMGTAPCMNVPGTASCVHTNKSRMQTDDQPENVKTKNLGIMDGIGICESELVTAVYSGSFFGGHHVAASASGILLVGCSAWYYFASFPDDIFNSFTPENNPVH